MDGDVKDLGNLIVLLHTPDGFLAQESNLIMAGNIPANQRAAQWKREKINVNPRIVPDAQTGWNIVFQFLSAQNKGPKVFLCFVEIL